MRSSRTTHPRLMPILATGTFCVLVWAHAVAAQTPPPPPPAGQQHQHDPPPKPPVVPPADQSQMDHGALPAAREGSGTAWLPDASPMYAIHRQRGPWQFMS